jgi:hypothetical protein
VRSNGELFRRRVPSSHLLGVGPRQPRRLQTRNNEKRAVAGAAVECSEGQLRRVAVGVVQGSLARCKRTSHGAVAAGRLVGVDIWPAPAGGVVVVGRQVRVKRLAGAADKVAWVGWVEGEAEAQGLGRPRVVAPCWRCSAPLQGLTVLLKVPWQRDPVAVVSAEGVVKAPRVRLVWPPSRQEGVSRGCAPRQLAVRAAEQCPMRSLDAGGLL